MAETLKLGFLMFPGFPMACLTSAIEPLRAANEITGTRAFEWVLLAETLEPVRSSAEVRFTPDLRLEAAAGLDQVYLLSSPTGQFGALDRTSRKQDEQSCSSSCLARVESTG